MSRDEKETKRKGGAIKLSTARALTALAVVAAVCVGLAFHTGTGTPSSWGLGMVSTLCPLGALESAIASRTIIPAGVIGLAIMVVLILVIGRAFCSWGCPVPLLRRIFGLERARKKTQKKTGKSDDSLPDPKRGGVSDSRNWVLGGVILSTAAFGFPVFCLVCPIGLTFATIILLWRVFQFGETTLSLIVFPAMLVLEIVVLRKWCHKLCPLGALIALISRGNKTFKATLDPNRCIATTGKGECGRCTESCSEGIDLHEGALTTPANECLKCGECKSACPVGAISFPFLPKRPIEQKDHVKESK